MLELRLGVQRWFHLKASERCVVVLHLLCKTNSLHSGQSQFGRSKGIWWGWQYCRGQNYWHGCFWRCGLYCTSSPLQSFQQVLTVSLVGFIWGYAPCRCLRRYTPCRFPNMVRRVHALPLRACLRLPWKLVRACAPFRVRVRRSQRIWFIHIRKTQ